MALDKLHHFLKEQNLTEREDFSECPLSFRTAKEAVLERQPSSRHTPSHLTVWLVFHMGNCGHMAGVRRLSTQCTLGQVGANYFVGGLTKSLTNEQGKSF
jgi:hypothetical protein